MKLLLIPSWYPDESRPLRGIFFREQAEALARRGHEITVLAPERFFPRGPRAFLKGLVQARSGFSFSEENGLTVYRNASARLLPASRFPLAEYRAERGDSLRFMPRLLAERGPFDLIHAHSAYWGGAVAEVLSAATGIPYVITEHRSNLLTGSFPARVRRVIARVLRGAALRIAVSEGLAAAMGATCQTPRDRILILPNLVSSLLFSHAHHREGDEFHYCAVAGLKAIKRHDLLLAAFALIRGKIPGTRLHLVGDGPLRADLERRAEELGLSDAITWHGPLPPAGVSTVMGTSDALVLSSDFETFGIVLAEAWASGIPVVATRCGGPDSMVKPGNGILVDAGDPKALAAGMIEVYEHRDRYDPERIRAEALAEYGEASVIARLESAYEVARGRHGIMEEA